MTQPSYEERAAQVRAVLALMDDGMAERPACEQVGINRATFRAAALKVNAADHYASACEGIAKSQVDLIEALITEMREGSVDPSVGRLELDARKWIASKLFPRQWGDKQQIEHTGHIATDTPDEELDRRLLAHGIDPATLKGGK